MKKLLSILISITLLFNVIPAFTVNAATYGKYGNFNYVVVDIITDKYIEITGYDYLALYDQKTLEIPSKIDGIPVKSIGHRAFANIPVGFSSPIKSIAKSTVCYGLEEIILPNSIKTIGTEAFAYRSSLKKINIPSGVTYIDDRAFMGDSEITIYGAKYKYPTSSNRITKFATTYAYDYAKSHNIPFHATDELSSFNKKCQCVLPKDIISITRMK